MDVEQRGRELLAAEYEREPLRNSDMAKQIRRGVTHNTTWHALAALRAALTPPEGHVIVTRNEAGQTVAVTRQDNEGRTLSVISEFEPPKGYVLVQMIDAKRLCDGDTNSPGWELSVLRVRAAMLAARPEVKPRAG